MTASKRSIGSDLAKVDAYENTQADYEEIPDMSDRDPAEGVAQGIGVPRIGRPPLGSGPKQQVTLRLDPEVQTRFRSSGPGWQARMNTFLARNKEVLKMIVDFDEFIAEMEVMIGYFQRGEVRAVHEMAERTLARIETNIRNTKETVRSLREQLVW